MTKSRKVNLEKKKIKKKNKNKNVQTSCNVFLQNLTVLPTENMCFLNMKSVHAARILDLSLEIMPSPPKTGMKHLYLNVNFHVNFEIFSVKFTSVIEF